MRTASGSGWQWGFILAGVTLLLAAGCMNPSGNKARASRPAAQVRFSAKLERIDASSADITCTLAYPPRKPRGLDQPAKPYLLSPNTVSIAGLNGPNPTALPYEVLTITEDVSMTSWTGTQADYRKLVIQDKNGPAPASYAVMKAHVFSPGLANFDRLTVIFDATGLDLNAGKLTADIPLSKLPTTQPQAPARLNDGTRY